VSDWLGLQVWYVVAGLLSVATGLAFFFVPAIANIEENANGAGAKTEPLTLTEADA
jgi:hypothetical protein